MTEPEARTLIESAGLTSPSSWGYFYTLIVIVPEGEERKWIGYFQNQDIVAAACVDAHVGLLTSW